MKYTSEASPPIEFDSNDCFFLNENGECSISKTECIPQSFCHDGIQIKKTINKMSETFTKNPLKKD